MRQFDSIPNLLRMLAGSGKMPSWVGQIVLGYREAPVRSSANLLMVLWPNNSLEATRITL